jgi:hypothetical protein
MYPSSSKCLAGGWPRPAGCHNETTGLWVYPQVNKDIFEPGRLGPNTKVLLVPPTWGSHHPCTSGPPSVWCTNQTYAEWLELNHGNFSFYTQWGFTDERIVGFDPWPLSAGGSNSSSMALGLLGMPEVLAEYKALGAAIVARRDQIDSEGLEPVFDVTPVR